MAPDAKLSGGDSISDFASIALQKRRAARMRLHRWLPCSTVTCVTTPWTNPLKENSKLEVLKLLFWKLSNFNTRCSVFFFAFDALLIESVELRHHSPLGEGGGNSKMLRKYY